jgi:hypothetical protein
MQTLLFTIGRALTLSGPLSAVPVGNAASFTLTAAGGTAPYRITLVSSQLPAEWTLSPTGTEDVTISTSEALEPGTYSFTYRVKDAARNTRLITRSITAIALPLELSGTLDAATRDVAYSDSLTRTGGVGPFTYSVLSGSLPTGLSLDASTGVVSGTPTVSDTYTFVIRVTDSLGATADSAEQSLTVSTDFTAARRELRQSIVMWWSFANTLNDSARAGNHWTASSTSYTTGPSGAANTALNRNSVGALDALVTLKGINALHPSQPFSIGGFVKRDNLATRVYCLSTAGSALNPVVSLQISGGTDKVELQLGTTQTAASTGTINDNDWHHVVATSDGTNVRFYIDGALDSTVAITATSLVDTASRIWFGDVDSAGPMEMTVAQHFYAHAAIGADAVSYLYNDGDGRDYSDFSTVAYGTTFDAYAASLLVAGDGFWKMSETSGVNAADSVSGGIGTMVGINGAVMNTSIDPPPGFSSADGVGECDGANDHFDGPDISFAAGSLHYTQAIWVNPDTLTSFDVWFEFGTASGSNANARALFLNSATTAAAQFFNGAGTVLESSSSGFGGITAGSWHFVAAVYSGSTLMCFEKGYAVNGAATAATPTAVNLTNNYIGGRATTQTADGKFSRALFAKGHYLRPAEIAKLYDLGMGSG